MGKKARSARGVIVDFDLMKIKEQIASAPTPLEVKARQDFIENRLKRRIKKAQNTVDVEKEVAPKLPEPSKSVDESHIEDAEKEVASEALAAVEAESEELVEVEPKEAPKTVTKKRTTKQRARPKKTTTTEPETEDKEE